MSDGGLKPGEHDSDESLELLRSKYLDYCSAQLAELLLRLSPDEIFVISEKLARARPNEAEPRYGRIVEVATEWLADRVDLPPFDEWVRDYRENPDRYDRHLIGLWESGASAGTADTSD